MLKLRKSFHLPRIIHITPAPQLRTEPIDRDDLLEELRREREADMISLDNTTAQQLGHYWAGVEEDLKSDPTWYDFADD